MKHTALVTGGSRGIGYAIAKKLDSYGMNVLLPTRSELDLLSDISIENYLAGLRTCVDVIINNAGINPIAAITDIKNSDIIDTMQINLLAPLKIIRYLVPSMIDNGYGKIVNISSIWSTVSKPGRTVYSASKSALNGITRTMAVELAKSNILINAVAPGFVNTELTQQNNSHEDIQLIKKGIPMERLAEPSEIAELVYFLISDANTYITGQTIFIDGGFTCQ
jgi:NAD(P)-dependent dehydrogenase (short-subunit alcohol dehydrogenase family)